MSDDRPIEAALSPAVQPDGQQQLAAQRGVLPAWASTFTVTIEPTAFTFTFFQTVMASTPTPGQAARQVVPTLAVTMSPILAKDLHKALTRVIEGYEKNTKAIIPDIPTTPFSA